MAQVDLIMPKMGESIMEATILRWVKQVGDTIEADETVLEIATDKVDSEVPSPVSGTLVEILYKENDVVEVGKPIAVIATEGETAAPAAPPAAADKSASNGHGAKETPQAPAPQPEPVGEIPKSSGDRFYSPLVRTIAEKENISLGELDRISGTGSQGRVTKKDILAYVGNRTQEAPAAPIAPPQPAAPASRPASEPVVSAPAVSLSGDVEIIEMDRMRKLIADHMVNSKRTSPHVTSFVEVDVTNLVNWRNRVKKTFEQRYGEKITFTPIFIEAVVKATTSR